MFLLPLKSKQRENKPACPDAELFTQADPSTALLVAQCQCEDRAIDVMASEFTYALLQQVKLLMTHN